MIMNDSASRSSHRWWWWWFLRLIYDWLFRDIKIKSRAEFEEDFDGIKELIAAKTLFMVDDKISMFEEVRKSFFLSENLCLNLTNLLFSETIIIHQHKWSFSIWWWHHQHLAFSCWFSIVNWQNSSTFLNGISYPWKVSSKSGFVNIIHFGTSTKS